MMSFLVNLLLFLCIWKETKARKDITVDSSACKSYYDMEDINDAYVTYRGASLSEECYIKFINWDSFQKDLCVKAVKMKLGCTTKIEYFRHFISEHLDPKRRFTCRNESISEWCGGKRTSYLFIVFRTSGSDFGSDTVLHVYLKDFPKEKDIWDSSSSSTSTVAISVVIIGVLVAVIVIVLVTVIVLRKRALRTPFPYRTSTGLVPMQTSTAPLQPQYLPQQQQQESAQGNYQWHPVQSAYPMSAQQSTSPLITQQQTPSAPTLDYTAPPPPYHSVVK